MNHTDTADGLRPDTQPRLGASSPISRLTVVFLAAWLLSLLAGAAVSGLLHLSEDQGARAVLHDYLVWAPSGEGVAGLLSFLSLCLFDIQCLLLVFAFGFSIFPAAAGGVILAGRGLLCGVMLGMGVSAGFFARENLAAVLLLGGSQFCSCTAVLAAALASAAFGTALRRAGGQAARIFRGGLLGRYCFRLCLSLGLAAAAGGLRLLLALLR